MDVVVGGFLCVVFVVSGGGCVWLVVHGCLVFLLYVVGR